MATTPTTALQYLTNNLGGVVPLCYGRVRATGNQLILQQNKDNSRVAFYFLGEGEWDGIDRLWVNSKLVTNAAMYHFHPGLDGTIGAGLAATSTGGDQKADQFFTLLPGGIQPLGFSRRAYIALNVPADPGAPSSTLTVIGDYRTTKVRQFDVNGNQTAYSFSTNPAWCILDAIFRFVLKREALLNAAVSAAEKTRINFASFYNAAQYYDFDITLGGSNGPIKRFEMNYAFAQQLTVQALIEQLLLMSRSYLLEDEGVLSLYPDQPRNSTFTLSADHYIPGTLQIDEKSVRGSANHFVGKFNDTNPTIVSSVSFIQRQANVVTVTTASAHPFLVGDWVNVFNVLDPTYDGSFQVKSVTSTSFTYAQTGANSTSSGGSVGTNESLYAQRSTIDDHAEHQLAIGQRGLGLTTISKKIELDLDYGNNTGERVRRLLWFQKVRSLGPDSTPYKAPWTIHLKARAESVDAGGNALIAQLRGDVITIDHTVSEELAGQQFEIVEMDFTPQAGNSNDPNSSSVPTATQKMIMSSAVFNPQEAGLIDLTLLQFESSAFTDVVGAGFNTAALNASSLRNAPFALAPPGIFDNDGKYYSTVGLNLVPNGDFSLYTQNTGQQSTYASSVRFDDNDNAGNPQQTPNGWTRNFESGGNGEGVIYRSALGAGGFSPAGSYSLVLQDAKGAVGDAFAAVCDAFPVVSGRQYKVSAVLDPGYSTGLPTHARWYFRVLFYKAGTTDFSRSSATLSAQTPTGSSAGSGYNSAGFVGGFDIAAGSALSGALTAASVITAPSDAAFARIAFYHWNDGTNPASAWNLVLGDVRCVPVIAIDDEVFDGSDYARTHSNQLLSGTVGGRLATGRNIAANPGFEINNTKIAAGTAITAAAPMVDEWYVLENDSSVFAMFGQDSSLSTHSGKYCALIRAQQNVTVPANSNVYGIACNPLMPCVPGATVVVSGYLRWDNNAALPTGCTGDVYVGIRYYDLNGAYLGETLAGITAPSAAWTRYTVTGTIPTNAASMQVEIRAGIHNTGTGNVAFNTSTNLYMDARFDDLNIIFMTTDGEAAFNASTHLNGQGSLVGFGAPANFSYSSTSTSITVSWTASSVPRPDQSSVPYAAGSAPAFTGLTGIATYHFGIYVDDAGVVHVVMSDNSTAKGSLAWQVQTIGADGHNVITVDYTASTPGSGTGGGSGGGSGGSCPADDEPMETLELGVVGAVQVESRMHVRAGDGTWREVLEAYSVPGWLQWVELENDGWHHVDVNHKWLRPEGDYRAPLDSDRDWISQRDLRLRMYVKGSDGALYKVLRISQPHPGSYRKIRVQPGPDGDRSMRMGKSVTHNFNTL